MKQSRAMSLVEAVANVAVGYGVAVLTQILIFPVFGLHTTLAQNLKMGAVFTLVSIARSYALRRVFETIRMRRTSEGSARGGLNGDATP
jgi:hypothetical protein